MDEYLEHFLNTLLPTNKTYSYFVDWNKVLKNVSNYREELALLNTLRGETKASIKPSFIKLVKKYPAVTQVLPLLIAERMKNDILLVWDEELDEFLQLCFRCPVNEEGIKELAKFCEKTGIFDLILRVKDLYDYMLGVEVGMDTNTRKNRSGKIFEKMVEKVLLTTLNKSYHITSQDPYFSLYVTKKGKRINRHDFVVYKDNHPVAVIEVNFYNTVGSKPDSIVGNYISLSQEAQKKGVEFIWITDGPAWKNMKHYLRKAMEEIDWVLNYRIAKDKIKMVL